MPNGTYAEASYVSEDLSPLVKGPNHLQLLMATSTEA